MYDELLDLARQGKPIYVKYYDGDRKGSIARFVLDLIQKDPWATVSGSSWRAMLEKSAPSRGRNV